jgi:hypothetical protein
MMKKIHLASANGELIGRNFENYLFSQIAETVEDICKTAPFTITQMSDVSCMELKTPLSEAELLQEDGEIPTEFIIRNKSDQKEHWSEHRTDLSLWPYPKSTLLSHALNKSKKIKRLKVKVDVLKPWAFVESKMLRDAKHDKDKIYSYIHKTCKLRQFCPKSKHIIALTGCWSDHLLNDLHDAGITIVRGYDAKQMFQIFQKFDIPELAWKDNDEDMQTRCHEKFFELSDEKWQEIMSEVCKPILWKLRFVLVNLFQKATGETNYVSLAA